MAAIGGVKWEFSIRRGGARGTRVGPSNTGETRKGICVIGRCVSSAVSLAEV